MMAVCVTVPIIEFVVHYHNSFLSGHDTVANLIAVVLCAALAVPAARAIFALYAKLLTLQQIVVSAPLQVLSFPADLVAPPNGPPPPLLLRI